MSKLNTKTAKTVPTNRDLGYSYNGNLQTLKSPEQQLFELAVTALYGKDNYYESTGDQVARLRACVDTLVQADKALFAANVAVFARDVMLIRTMPIVLIVELAAALRKHNKELPSFKHAVAAVIERADALTDVYAYALSVFGDKKKVPMAIKNGVAKAFNKFDEYQFAKYNSKAAVKLKDLLRIVHPTPENAEKSELFKKIMTDTLSTPSTWETKLSANGQLAVEERREKSEVWGELIENGELGYMATLRNLRNMLDAGVSAEVLTKVVNRIANRDQVKKSKQFPFAFVKAAQAIDAGAVKTSYGIGYGGYSSSRGPALIGSKDTKHVATGSHGTPAQRERVLNALSQALDHSVDNIPALGQNVVIIVDCSGSMQGMPFDTACLFAAAAAKSSSLAENVAVLMFSDRAEQISIRRNDSVLSIFESLQKKNQGGGTELQAALNLVPKLGFKPDAVLCLSDMQVNSLRGFNSANTVFGRDCLKLAFNLNAYDSTPMSDIDGWIQLSGWSEKIFDFVEYRRNATSIVEQLSETQLF